MAIVVRVIVVIFAFLVACFTAAMVFSLGLLVPLWNNPEAIAMNSTWTSFAFFAFVLSGVGLLPAFIVIILAESLGIRSPLFYAAAGGLGLIAHYYAFGFADHGGPAAGPLHRELEIMAGAGIAAGFVYWAIAGRRAGAWRRTSEPKPPAPTDG